MDPAFPVAFGRNRAWIRAHKALLGFGNSMRIAFGTNPKGGKAGAPMGNPNSANSMLQKNRNHARGRTRD